MEPINVTVLMPVYNGEKFLRESIDSILNQTFSNFEFVIVNDGSTDNTVDIINSYRDARIKLINQKNGGVSNALNTGLKHATGKYIARMDADDISHPERIEKQYKFIQNNPEYVIVGSDANYITEEKEFIFKYTSPAYNHQEIVQLIPTYCTFIHTSVLVKRDTILEVGGYSEDAVAFEDHFLWTKMIDKGLTCNLKEVLVDVRLNSGSVTIDFNDYDKKYLETKEKVLKTGEITEEDAFILKNSYDMVDEELKAISYYRLLAKKYLWSNYNLKKARENIKLANQIAPYQKKTIFLFLISLLPKNIISFIYSLKKK